MSKRTNEGVCWQVKVMAKVRQSGTDYGTAPRRCCGLLLLSSWKIACWFALHGAEGSHCQWRRKNGSWRRVRRWIDPFSRETPEALERTLIQIHGKMSRQ